MIYKTLTMVSIIIGTTFSKCKHAKYKAFPEPHQILDLCITNYDERDRNSTQFLCGHQNGKTIVTLVEYSDPNCQNEIVRFPYTQHFNDIHCEPQDECDYIQFAEWTPEQGQKCGSGEPYKETEYNTNAIFTTLDYVGECIPDPSGNDASMCIEINSCDDGIINDRMTFKQWENNDCSGDPALTMIADDEGENDYPDDEGDCSNFIKCAPGTMITTKKCPGSLGTSSPGSAGIININAVIVCVVFGVINGIFSLF